MKKFIAIFAIIATFGFVACNNAAETTEEATDSTQVEATTEVEEAPAADSTAAPADSTAAAPAK
jgi:uncharacterized lipoprotein NlpE involved in copper resistance